MKKLNFLPFLILLFLASCEKEKTSVPTIITIDELLNTDAKEVFVCLMNGEYWEDNTINTSYSVSAGILNVESKKGSQNLIGFGTLQVFKEDTYIPLVAVRGISSCTFNMDTSALNEINILRIDHGNREIFGTFEFHLISNSNDCFQESLNVTEGRFKIPF